MGTSFELLLMACVFLCSKVDGNGFSSESESHGV